MKSWFGVYMDASRTLAHIMEGYKDIPASERRGYFDLMLKQALLANPELVGVWSDWAPNALDGMDARYANTPGTDASGRYVPVWGNGANGLFVEPLAGYDTSAFYTLPMQTLVRNAGNVQELMGASEVGRTGLQEVAADIQEIARESEGLRSRRRTSAMPWRSKARGASRRWRQSAS
jgi:hypothetical protein